MSEMENEDSPPPIRRKPKPRFDYEDSEEESRQLASRNFLAEESKSEKQS